jgi:hypothetical protein
MVGRLFPRDDDTVAQAAFDQLAAAVPGAVALSSPTPGPSAMYSARFDRLIVLDDLNLIDGGPYDWAPVQIDQNKPGNRLSDWLALPWDGPDEVILPGFHTAAEDALKSRNPLPGNEVFLSVCAMMSSGAQTVLLSRWRTGGRSSFELVQEFAQELPHTTPAEAWQRSVFLCAGSELELDAEPRIKRVATETSMRANHPFFWAAYLLVDSGRAPARPDTAPPVDEPVVRPENPVVRPGAPPRESE